MAIAFIWFFWRRARFLAIYLIGFNGIPYLWYLLGSKNEYLWNAILWLWTIAIIVLKVTVWKQENNWKEEEETDYQKLKGNELEKRVERQVGNIDRPFIKRKGKTLRNVYIPKGDGSYTEIDILWINERGIAAIECKNYKGWIFGTDTHDIWTQSLIATGYTSEKHKFYNPIKQNANHIKYLKKYIKKSVPFDSFIVFANRAVLKDIRIEKERYESRIMWVGNESQLARIIRKYLYTQQKCLTTEEINEIYEELVPLMYLDKQTKQDHIDRVNKIKRG